MVGTRFRLNQRVIYGHLTEVESLSESPTLQESSTWWAMKNLLCK